MGGSRRGVGSTARALVVVVALLLVALAGGPASSSAATVVYEPPVDGGVLRPFEAPASEYGPGHRGLDLDAAPGTPVRAAAPGRVVHAGPVVGVVWVSLDHADGIRTSYGPLDDLRVRAGDRVASGQPLGRLAAGGHGDGGRDRGLHLGARRGSVYLDPALLLGWARPSLEGSGDHPATPEASPVPAPRPRRAARPGPPTAP